MEINEDLKQQLKNISSDESNLDLNKILNFTENLIKDQQAKSQKGKEEALEQTSLKGFSSLVKDENLESLVKMARNLVNPTTLSLLSKESNTLVGKQAETKEVSSLKLSVELLSNELDKVRKESEELKLQWKEIKSEYTELQNQVTELQTQYTEVQTKLTALKRRRL